MERTQSAQEDEPALRSPRRRGSIPLLGSLPPAIPLNPATPSPTRSAKKWAFFSLDPFVSSSPTRSHPESPLSAISRSCVAERRSTERDNCTGAQEPTESSDAPKPAAKKRGKKQKKVKTWAGSILSRKGKHRHGKHKRRAPTPPPPRHFELVKDGDDGETMHMSLEPEPPAPTFAATQSSGNGDWETWTFPKPVAVPDEDASYPMIDLDAALGPFNTPLPRNPEWEAAQRAGGLVKKQLHSAAGMSRFSGPGMHYYHRRAESAPELVPFEGGRFGFRRFGSSSTMADVFEEDEEEEEESAGSSNGPSTPAVGTSVAEKSEAATHSEVEPRKACQDHGPTGSSTSSLAEAVQRKPCEAGEVSSSARSASEQPGCLACDDTVLTEPVPPFLAEESLPGDANSGSATPSPRHVSRPKDLAPVELSPLNLPTASLGPVSPWSMTQSSAFPSPRSPMSYDAQCISTAPSSVAEDNFQSLLLGEPGPEVRISVDDVPSLTSSNSTMTRESLFAQLPQARHPPLGEHPRPASFTSTAFGRRRSSLASLSRLVNSSHGERSKLSIEVPMDSEPDKKAKSSKTKRLSRMMQFWKSKETNKA
ncbi:80d89ea5-716e-4c24-9b5b-e0e10e9b9a7e [Thermothielavioides terrestris]|nr:80d89ea5-716e-4c24-9b5b-e0e10e9b9a7e [Thermothielavioides terrestris]